MQLDRLMHAVEYLGFSRIKMNYDLLDLLSSDCLRIKRKNRYEGLYIAYYMTNFRLFANSVAAEAQKVAYFRSNPNRR